MSALLNPIINELLSIAIPAVVMILCVSIKSASKKALSA